MGRLVAADLSPLSTVGADLPGDCLKRLNAISGENINDPLNSCLIYRILPEGYNCGQLKKQLKNCKLINI